MEDAVQDQCDLAEWHDRQIADITRSDIKDLLRVKARSAPISANRLKSLISKIFTWALKEEIIRHPRRSALTRLVG